MDFEFSADTIMLRDMVRRFVEREVQPLEMTYFTYGALNEEDRGRLRSTIDQLGLWGVMAPEEHGGFGLDLLSLCVLEEELGKTFVPVDLGDVPPLLYACTDEQVTRYLEPALAGERRAFLALREPAGSLPEQWTTTATANGAGYYLEGKKLLAGRPDEGDFLVVVARAPAGPTAFLLDVSEEADGLMLIRNGRESVLTLRNYHTGPESVLGEEGGALQLARTETAQTAVRTGARYVGMAERLLEMAATHAQEWSALGAPLANRPAVQRILAEMRVQIDSARLTVYHAAWAADKNPAEAAKWHARVRLTTGEMLQRCVDLATMVFGGPGPSPATEAQRFVQSMVPAETLAAGMALAQAAIAADVLAMARR